jgi:hypothetical protein
MIGIRKQKVFIFIMALIYIYAAAAAFPFPSFAVEICEVTNFILSNIQVASEEL